MPCATPAVPAPVSGSTLVVPLTAVPCNVMLTEGKPAQLSERFCVPLVADVEPTEPKAEAATFPKSIEALVVETVHVEFEAEIGCRPPLMKKNYGAVLTGSVVL